MRDSTVKEFSQSWRVLLASAVGLSVCVTGVPYYTIGVFVDPLAKALGWSRADISVWNSCLMGGLIVMFPLVGKLLDRLGARKVALTAIPLLALSIASMSFLSGSIWRLYLTVTAMAVLGAGACGITYNKVINNWFDSGRGLALGIAAAGIGLVSMVSPRVVQFVVDGFGWRMGFVCVALAVLSAWPVVFFWIHERSEPNGAEPMRPPNGLTRNEAVATPVFWLQGASYLIFAMVPGGLVFALIPFITDHGLGRVAASEYAGLLGLSSLVGRLVTGVLFDRLNAPRVCAAVYLGAAFGVGLLGVFNLRFLGLSTVLIGFSVGTEVNALSYCTYRFFGLKAFGQIYGLISVLHSIGSGIGPFLVLRLKESSGGFELPFLVLTLAGLAGALLMLIVGGFRYRAIPVAQPA